MTTNNQTNLLQKDDSKSQLSVPTPSGRDSDHNVGVVSPDAFGSGLRPQRRSCQLFSRGFTLIELLVAVTLFLVVVTIASSTFIESLKSQRAAVELMAVNDNVSGTLEFMAREIRTGMEFSTPSAESLVFTNAAGKKVEYHFNNERASIEKSIDGELPESLTATNVVVKRFKIIGDGLAANDGKQSKITISIEIGGKSKNLQDITTKLQTTISPRTIDG